MLQPSHRTHARSHNIWRCARQHKSRTNKTTRHMQRDANVIHNETDWIHSSMSNLVYITILPFTKTPTTFQTFLKKCINSCNWWYNNNRCCRSHFSVHWTSRTEEAQWLHHHVSTTDKEAAPLPLMDPRRQRGKATSLHEQLQQQLHMSLYPPRGHTLWVHLSSTRMLLHHFQRLHSGTVTLSISQGKKTTLSTEHCCWT